VWFDHYFYYDNVEQLKPRSTIIESHKYYLSCKVKSKDFFERMIELNRDTFWFSVMGMIDFKYLKSIKLKFLDGVIHEDHHFGKLLFFQSNFIYILTQKLYFYRIRQNSIMDYDFSGLYIPEYDRFTYEIFDKNYFLYRKYLTLSSKALTALMVFKFIHENEHLNGMMLLKKVFWLKLKNWRNSLVDFDDKYLNKAISLTIKKFYIMSSNSAINLELMIDFASDIAHIRNNETNLVLFYSKYGTAKLRVQNHLSYKLGKVLIINSKSIFGILMLPIYLLSIIIADWQEKRIYHDNLKKDPLSALPSLKKYPDYQEAIKIQNHFSYKLGQVLIKNCKIWYNGGIFKLPFSIRKIYKSRKNK
ncbi:glycosyltransferase family 2 protein, partial [Campylobacter sp. IFREMER_LSEM_CL2194]|nr:glycosyltransferase family 2 protein [Campylobacter sp. IFREMER_LSEM_CL2194]